MLIRTLNDFSLDQFILDKLTLDKMTLDKPSAVSGSGGIDAYTKLMLHCNGTNGSTTFTDSSLTPKTPITTSAVSISTALSKFSGASASINNAFIQYADIADFQLSKTFTIDFWIYKNGNPSSNFQGILDKYTGSAAGWAIDFSDNANIGKITFITESNSIISSTNVCNGVWHHVAVVGDGTNGKLYIDGISEGGTIILPNTLANIGHDLFIGGDNVSTLYPTCYIDEIRISNGIARWNNNFPLPTQEYTA